MNSNYKINIYTAGAISYYYKENKKHLAKKWRSKVKKYFEKYDHMSVYDPTVNVDMVLNNRRSLGNEICASQNKEILRQSNIVICDLDDIDKSPGTIFELVLAREVFGIPVYSRGMFSELSLHIRHCISFNFLDLDDLLSTVKDMYINL